MAQKTAQTPIPKFHLYGDEQRDVELDSVHIEPIRVRSMRHDWTIYPHVHPDHLQILWLRKGGATFRIEDETLVAAENTLVVQPAGTVHEIRFDPGTEGLVTTVALSYLDLVAHDDPRLIEVTRSVGTYPLSGTSDVEALVAHAFPQLATEAAWTEPGRRTAIKACILQLLVALVRLRRAQVCDEPRLRDRDYEIVTRYRALLDRRFRTEKTLTFYARELGVSAQRLNAACKARVGRTASETLHDRILTEAKRNLLYTEMTVAEIGHALGYDDPAYFNRFFSQRVGTAPGTYRAQSATTQRVGG